MSIQMTPAVVEAAAVVVVQPAATTAADLRGTATASVVQVEAQDGSVEDVTKASFSAIVRDMIRR